MRTLLCVLLASLCGSLQANEIDRLKTRDEVERFLNKVEPSTKKWQGELVREFFKLDLDDNGLTDVVIAGDDLFVIMDLGSQYRCFLLGEMGGSFGMLGKLIAIDSTGRPKMIVISRKKGQFWRDTTEPPTYPDTLVGHFGELMEYNAYPADEFRFEGIRVSTSQCFGSCPIFEMEVLPNRKASYHAIRFNDETGYFQGVLSKKELDTLMEVLRYLPLDRLKSSYEVIWTDDQTIDVEIRYNGRVKRFRDYGEQGTIGLEQLYALFFRWKTEVEWTENQ